MNLDTLIEKGLLPDFVLRKGIRALLRQRLREDRPKDPESRLARLADHLEVMDASPIAVHTQAAREQHYEVPTEFFQTVLGTRLKYSCGYWPEDGRDLHDSEEAMLELTRQRAGIEKGMRVLDLGCGWGAFSLFLAEHYTECRVTALSHSQTQIEHIRAEAERRGLTNLEAIRADANDLPDLGTFDRIVSVEMFEHMRNHRQLLRTLAGMLNADGKLFVHIFTHKDAAYFFEAKDDSDWMSRYFFTGGMMPSRDLLLHFQDDMAIEQTWSVNGRHYQKTLEAWLARMDEQRAQVWPILERTYGEHQARRWWNYWRVFFMACSELFGYDKGREWFVSHYLFTKRRALKAA